MTTTNPSTQALASWDELIAPDEAELAALAFLARYSGRTLDTLDAYRHDLGNLFQWAADHSLSVLEATRPRPVLTGASHSEMWEPGYAHALGKQAPVLCRYVAAVPDVRLVLGDAVIG